METDRTRAYPAVDDGNTQSKTRNPCVPKVSTPTRSANTLDFENLESLLLSVASAVSCFDTVSITLGSAAIFFFYYMHSIGRPSRFHGMVAKRICETETRHGDRSIILYISLNVVVTCKDESNAHFLLSIKWFKLPFDVSL